MNVIRLVGRVGFLGVALLLTAALGFAPFTSADATGPDYGDAPDGAKAGYTAAPAVVGHFPSKAASAGPRHALIFSLFLGAGESGELSSPQVDKDTFDDGVETTLRKCGSSTLKVLLNGKTLPAATLASDHTAFVNAWFDWNRDGDWADGSDGCSAEWAIRNLPVSMDKLAPGGGIAVVPVGFTAGKEGSDVWERVTLTLDQPVTIPSGAGPPAGYLQGETEDSLVPAGSPSRRICIKPKKKKGCPPPPPKGKKGKFKVSCKPAPAIIPHGGSAAVKFVIVDKGTGFINGAFGSPVQGPSGKVSLTPLKPQPKGVPPGRVAASGFNFKSTKVDPPPRVQKVVVKLTFSRGNQTQRLDCAILIVHFGAGNPFIPRIICGGICRSYVPLVGNGMLQPNPPNSFFDVFFQLPVDSFKVVLPSSNQVSNPNPSPQCAVATTATSNDSLLCTGPLPATVHATGSFQASSAISPGTAKLYGRQQGAGFFEGPFQVSGP